ncbi:MAG: hypothetical protein HY703_12250, partial [Gemmatimonadetes bacterium]|nr:hypothetical protein [Gemmatimonadota bacterium]
MSARTIVLAAGLVLGVAACTERAPPLAPATDPEPRATYVGTPCVFTVSGSTMTLTADCTT